MTAGCTTHHYACACREAKLFRLIEDAYRAGFMEACRWPEPVTQDADSKALGDRMREWINTKLQEVE